MKTAQAATPGLEGEVSNIIDEGERAGPVTTLELREEAFWDEQLPVNQDMPWTSKFYDEVYEAASFPKPRCIIFESDTANPKCKCHSQQGTTLHLSYESCSYIAVHGWFDPSIDENKFDRDQARSRPNRIVDRVRLQPRPANIRRPTSTKSNQPLFTNWNKQDSR